MKNDVILVRYPFSNLSNSKIRPAVIVSTKHISKDVFIVPLTSKTASLLSREFILANWHQAGLNVPTAVKRGLYTVHSNLIAKAIGNLSSTDTKSLTNSLCVWLGV